MKKLISINFLFIVLLSIIFISGCMSKNETYNVVVTVTVTDASTSETIENANVVTEDGKSGSNSGGVVTFNLIGNQSYVFIASAPLYGETRQTVAVGKENLAIGIKLAKGKGSISGKIVDDATNPILGATLSIETLNRTTESNPDGTFKFDDVPFSDTVLTLKVSKTGYAERTYTNIKMAPDAPDKNLGNIILSSNPGILTGKIIDINDVPIDGVTVTITELAQSTTSDYNGIYTLNVLPGTYTVEFTNSKYEKVTKTGIEIKNGASVQLNVKLNPKPGSITGIVIDNYGNPVSDIQVAIIGQSMSTKTLSNGYFNFTSVPPGNYVLEISNLSFKTTNVQVKVESEKETILGNIQINEKVGIAVTGRVLDQDDNTAISGATVRILELGSSTNVNSDGYYTLQNPRIGTYTVEISANQYSTAQIPNVQIKENLLTTLPDTKLFKNPGTLVGNVKDDLTSVNLTNVTITLVESNTTTTTNEVGSFQIKNIKSGNYTVKFDLNNYDSFTSNVYIGPNQVLNMGDVRLSPKKATITGVTSPGGVTIQIKNGASIVSNPNGGFTLSNINPGSYTIDFSKSNYATVTKSINLTPNQVLDMGTINLNVIPGSIMGSVKNNMNLAPLSGVTVTIVELGITKNTDANGNFNISNVTPGIYSLKFELTNYVTVTQSNITVQSDQITNIGEVKIAPKKATIVGITSPGSVLVSIAGITSVTSSTNGAFTLSNIDPGTYTVDFSKTNYYPTTKSVTLTPNQTLDLGTITLTVIPGKIVGSTNATNVKVVQTNQTVSVTNSLFTINSVNPGTYTLRFTKTNYQTKDISVTVNSNSTTDTGNVELTPMNGSISGYINSAGCTVTLVEKNLSQYYASGAYFQFNDLVPKTYHVKIDKVGYLTKVIEVNISPGTNTDMGNIVPNSTVVPWTGVHNVAGSSTVKSGGATSQNFSINYDQKVNISYQAVYASLFIKQGNTTVWSHYIDGYGMVTGNVTKNLSAGTYTISHFTGGQTNYFTVNYYNDMLGPIISLSKTCGFHLSSISTTITATDSVTGVSYLGYGLSSTTTAPLSYTSISSGNTITINQTGEWYLIIKAIDNAGNVIIYWEGPFLIGSGYASYELIRENYYCMNNLNNAFKDENTKERPNQAEKFPVAEASPWALFIGSIAAKASAKRRKRRANERLPI